MFEDKITSWSSLVSHIADRMIARDFPEGGFNDYPPRAVEQAAEIWKAHMYWLTGYWPGDETRAPV